MSKAEFQIVRLQKNNIKVEVIGKPGMVTKFREGKCGLNDAVVDDRFYSDVAKGDLLGDGDLGAFDCRGRELLELVLKTGKYSLTAREKQEMTETRKAQVIEFIHSNFVDSTTGVPHPVTRIESALAQIKARYDPDESAEKIGRSLIPKLQTVIRLAESIIEGTVKVPVGMVGCIMGICHKYGTVKNEEYGTETMSMNMVISPGKYETFIDQLGKMSKGQAVFELKFSQATAEDTGEKEQMKTRKRKKR